MKQPIGCNTVTEQLTDDVLMDIRIASPLRTIFNAREYLRKLNDWQASGVLTMVYYGASVTSEQVTMFLQGNKPHRERKL